MITLFAERAGKPIGMSAEVVFPLVEELRRRLSPEVTEDSRRKSPPIQIHPMTGAYGGYCVVLRYPAYFEGVESRVTKSRMAVGANDWLGLLASLGVRQAETLPKGIGPDKAIGLEDYHEIVSPQPSLGCRVSRLLLEASPERFQALVVEVASLASATASLVKMTCRERGAMHAILVELESPISTGGLAALFPSARVIRVSEDGAGQVYSHLGTSCNAFVRFDLFLSPLKENPREGEGRAFVSFGRKDGTLGLDIATWQVADSLPLASFVKMSVRAPTAPLAVAEPVDLVATVDIGLARQDSQESQAEVDARIYLFRSGHPVDGRAMAALVDAVGLGRVDGAELWHAAWKEASGGISHAFLVRGMIESLERAFGVESYQVLDCEIRSARLGVRAGWEFVPYMPLDEDRWKAPLAAALIGDTSLPEGAYVLISPNGTGSNVGFTGHILPAFAPFRGFDSRVGSIGVTTQAELLEPEPSDGGRFPRLEAEAEGAWMAAAKAERIHLEKRSTELFDELRKLAVSREAELNSLRDKVDSLVSAASKFKKLPSELEAGIKSFVAELLKAIADIGMESKEWGRLLEDLASMRRRLEGHQEILDKVAQSASDEERSRLDQLLSGLVQRRQDLEAQHAAFEREHAATVARSDELAASLQTTKARVEVLETETIPLDETIYEFEALVAQQSALEGIRHAHAQMLHELRYAAGQATFASQQVSARRDHVQADLAKARDALSAIASEAASVERASQEARDQHQLVRTRRDALGAAKRALVALEDELKKSISGGDPRVEHTRLTREAAARQKDIADVQSTRDDLGRAEQRLVDLEAELAKAAEGLEVGQSKTRVAQVAALDRDLRDSIGAIEKAVLTMQAMRRQAMPPGTSASLGKLIDKAVKRLSEARLMYLASDATKVRNAAREMEEQSRILAEMADKLDGIRN